MIVSPEENSLEQLKIRTPFDPSVWPLLFTVSKRKSTVKAIEGTSLFEGNAQPNLDEHAG